MRRPLPTLAARRAPLAPASAQRDALDALDVPAFEERLARAGLGPLRATRVDTLQVNLGKLCNQTCRHCHVDAGPDRREVMSRETMQACLDALARTDIPTVDVTGGAPELVPHFRWFVASVRALGRHVMDRCNLTVIETPAHRDLPAFFAEHRVEVVASLPHYGGERTDRQRGEGVFDASIRALRRLNEVGYGDGRSGLRLVLVANPTGAFLPPSQRAFEADARRELARRHGVRFDALYTLANMPISRTLEWLVETGQLEAYMQRLVAAFNPRAVEGAMCRSLVSVAWDGALHDCDFNQMLELPLAPGAPRHVRDLDAAALASRPITVGRHCYGCTAGAGSSCGGATAA